LVTAIAVLCRSSTSLLSRIQLYHIILLTPLRRPYDAYTTTHDAYIQSLSSTGCIYFTFPIQLLFDFGHSRATLQLYISTLMTYTCSVCLVARAPQSSSQPSGTPDEASRGGTRVGGHSRSASSVDLVPPTEPCAVATRREGVLPLHIPCMSPGQH
jgi:hypothetical protein